MKIFYTHPIYPYQLAKLFLSESGFTGLSVIVNNNRESLLLLQEELLEKDSELTVANKSLQESLEEVNVLNSVLHERNEELQTLNTEKYEFLGIVAHDLKSPLSENDRTLRWFNSLSIYH